MGYKVIWGGNRDWGLGIGDWEKAGGRGQGDKGQIPITHYPLPITHYPLPITNYQLPITNYQLPNAQCPMPHAPLIQHLNNRPQPIAIECFYHGVGVIAIAKYSGLHEVASLGDCEKGSRDEGLYKFHILLSCYFH